MLDVGIDRLLVFGLESKYSEIRYEARRDEDETCAIQRYIV